MAIGGSLELRVVTPERLVLEEEVGEVVLPGSEGYLGVLPGHAPLMTALGVGSVLYTQGGKQRFLAVAGGWAEVLPHRVTVLADICERAEEIDPERARREEERARAALAGDQGDAAFREAQTSLRKALIRLEVHRHGQP